MLPELIEKFLNDTSPFPMLKLFYVWGHCYEFDQNDNWDVMEHFLKKIAGYEDIWYATNNEIEIRPARLSGWVRLARTVSQRLGLAV